MLNLAPNRKQFIRGPPQPNIMNNLPKNYPYFSKAEHGGNFQNIQSPPNPQIHSPNLLKEMEQNIIQKTMRDKKDLQTKKENGM